MEKTVQLQELQGLLNELSAEVAELSESVEEQKTNYVSTLNTGLADLLALLRNRKDPVAPVVNINVSPTPFENHLPAPVVQIIERVMPGDYEMVVTYDRFDRITRALISKVSQPTKV